MHDSARRSLRDRGQATLNWVAMLAAAALLVVGVAAAVHHTQVERIAASAYCRVAAALGGVDAGACAFDTVPGGPGTDAPDGGTNAQDQPWYCQLFGIGCHAPSKDGGDDPPKDQPWYCDWFGIGCDTSSSGSGQADVPEGMDPSSDLVKTLQSTQRGRDTLQWLSDHHIPIDFKKGEQGAYWDGKEIVIGDGYADPAVIVHETNHARASAEGKSADVNRQSREDYVTTAINEEVDGTVQQIKAAKEFRNAGHDEAQQPQEAEYDAAYQKAKQGGASDADAEAAGAKAVHDDFFGGQVITSNTNEPYTDYYGNAWDKAHPHR